MRFELPAYLLFGGWPYLLRSTELTKPLVDESIEETSRPSPSPMTCSDLRPYRKYYLVAHHPLTDMTGHVLKQEARAACSLSSPTFSTPITGFVFAATAPPAAHLHAHAPPAWRDQTTLGTPLVPPVRSVGAGTGPRRAPIGVQPGPPHAISPARRVWVSFMGQLCRTPDTLAYVRHA